MNKYHSTHGRMIGATVTLALLAACSGGSGSMGMPPGPNMPPVSNMPGPTTSPAAGSPRSHQTRVRNASSNYSIKDLGALPGASTSEVGLGTMSYGDALNSIGQATGASGGADTAVLFNNGGVTNINTLNASVSLGNAINASGQVAGEENASGLMHAFLYSNGSMQDINDNSHFPQGSQAYGINKSAQVVGAGFISSSNFHAFLYSNGQMTDLNPFNGFQSIARSINDSGQIIGSSTGNSAATWLDSNGTITVLSQTNSGYFISNTGQVVGVTGTNHGALYSNGTWTDLGTLKGATTTIALSINSSGQAVGAALFPAISYHPFIPGPKLAVIFNSNGPADLNKMIPSGSGYTLNYAVAINDGGQIAADATNSSKQRRALLLTPK